MNVFLNAGGDVTGSSPVIDRLELAQAKYPGTTQIVNNGPSGLIPLHEKTKQRKYHKYDNGDGTQLSHYVEVPYLEDKKELRRGEINLRTGELIRAGFEYNNIIFGASQHDQINWIGLYNNRSNFTYPLTVKGRDPKVYYDLQDAADVEGLWAAGVAHVNSKLQSGFNLKKQIDAAATDTDIDNIVDNRT